MSVYTFNITFFLSTTAARLGKITEMLHCGTTRVVSSLSPSVPACSPPTAYLSFDSPSSFPYLQCVAALAACVRHVAPSVRQPPTAWFTIAPSHPHARTVLCPTHPMSPRTHRVVAHLLHLPAHARGVGHSPSHLAHAKCCRPLPPSPRAHTVLSPTRSVTSPRPSRSVCSWFRARCRLPTTRYRGTSAVKGAQLVFHAFWLLLVRFCRTYMHPMSSTFKQI